MNPTDQLLKKRFLTTKEMAKILNLDPRSVRNLVERKEIPFMRVNRWHIRFDPDAILSWLKEREGVDSNERKIWEGRRKALEERNKLGA